MIVRKCVAIAWIGAIPLLSGCRAPVVDPATVEQLRLTPYPSNAPFRGDLDIVVRRERGILVLVNRTARTYDNVQLWLNQQHVGLATQVRIGGENRFELSNFINEHGEPYPIGGLLTPEETFPIVSVEMFDPVTGARYRLLVRSRKTLFG